jgi:type IV secretion system protein VirB5
MAVRRADMASPVPTSVIQYTLKEAVKNWRTVTADLKMRDDMSKSLSAVVRGSANGMLTEWFSKNNPVVRARNGRLVSVEVKGVPLPVSPTSWRIEWTETTRGHTGLTVETVQYEATMTVSIKPPSTDQEILQNPCGVFITELSFGTVLSKNSEALAASQGREVSQ